MKKQSSYYLRFTDEEFLNLLPTGQGVYFIIALNDLDEPIPLSRICGIDNDGILYIGCTPKRKFHERLKDLRRSMLPGYKSDGHSAGRTYKATPILMERFPITSIALRFEHYDAPKVNEDRLLEEYRLKFGEVPPLNSY